MRRPKPILLLASLALGLLASSVTAQSGRWERIGPEGGHVRVLAAAPSRPGTVYAGVDAGGVFRSSDRGFTWTLVGQGLGIGGLVRALGVDARSPETAYAVVDDELFKTVDGGASWRRIVPRQLRRGEGISTVQVHPRRAGNLYIVAGAGRLLRSADGGATWTVLPSPSSPSARDITLLAIDPAEPDALYAATEVGLFKSRNGGARWFPINQGLDRDKPVQALAFDPASRTIYLSQGNDFSEPIALFKSTDGGARWTSVSPGVGPGTVTELAVTAGPRPAVIAVLEGLDGRFLLRSEDGGRTWSRVEAGLPGFGVSLLATPNVLLAGTSEGVFRSGDRGLSWRASSQGLAATRIAGLAVDPETGWLYAGQLGAAPFRSTDGGASWVSLRRGIGPEAGSFSGPLAVDPQSPSRVYAGFAAGIGQSPDAGRSWDVTPVDCSRPGWIVFDAVRPDTLYVGDRRPILCPFGPVCAVRRSDDGGSTWTCVQNDFPSTTVDLLVADPVRESVLYAVVLSGPLYRSENGGGSWSLLAPNLEPTALAIDPANPLRLWAGVPGGLARSEDGGRTWDLLIEGLTGDRKVIALVVDPVDTSTLYAATIRDGIYKSTDAGETWTRLDPGWEEGVEATTLALDPRDRATLYAGTDGAGVMRLRQ
jgi:photosystem II stability/assembly factor-like uncharacterized protein